MSLKQLLQSNLDIESIDISRKPSKAANTNNFIQRHLSNNLSVYRITNSSESGIMKTRDTYCFIVPIKGKMHFNGCILDSSLDSIQLAVISPHLVADFSFKEKQVSYYIAIDKVTFDHQCELILGKEFTDLVQNGFVSMNSLSSKKALMQSLEETLQKHAISDISDTETASKIQSILIESLLTSEQESHCLNYCNKIALQVHSFLLTIRNIPLTLDQICEAHNANRNSIQRGFHELYGMGAVEYHKLFRIHQVRKYLRKNGTVSTNLVDIIGMYGFYHSGRFSQYYKRTFGILPSKERRELK